MGNSVRFDGQVAVVTGAGAGLGKAYALELARRGAKVVVNDLGSGPDGSGESGTAAEAVVQEIVAAGGEAAANTSSVATLEGADSIVATAMENYGRLDVLINNAGILRDKSFGKMSPADFDLLLDVHLKGSFLVSKAAFAQMKKQNYGRILFTASGAGLWGNFGQANYAAAKMGLVGLSSVVAIEGAKSGIQSNVIAPIARTRLTDALMPEEMGEHAPEQVAALSVYLVSQECGYSHEIFSAGAGWFGRVFVGATQGWTMGQQTHPSVENVRDHIAEICDEKDYSVPGDAAAIYETITKAFESC